MVTATDVRPRGSVPGMAVVKINAIEVAEDQAPELERRFAAQRHAMDGVPGFLGFQLLRPTANEQRYFVVTHWDDDASFQAWRPSSHGDTAHAEERSQPVSTGSSTLEFDVVDLDALAAEHGS